MALANPQSGFDGREATREMDRVWTVLMNIEANTRKTYEGVDKWVANMGSSNYSSGSSYSGGSSGVGSISSGGNDQFQQYLKVLGTWRSNFAAAGIVGGGSISYGSQGLGATPEQIAHNLVYGGMSPVGSVSGGGSSGQSSGYQFPEFSKRNSLYGFAPGGMIGGDTQKVEFFKSPNERVIIARPDQFADVRSDKADEKPQNPVVINLSLTVRSDGAPPSPASLASLQRAAALGTNAAVRAYRGR